MEKVPYFTLVTIVINFCLHGSCTSCTPAPNETVYAVLGEDVTLSCTLPLWCNTYWFVQSKLYNSFSSSLHSNRFQINKSENTSFLHISDTINDDAGSYKCFCYKDGIPFRSSEFYCINLTTICKATVRLDGERNLYFTSSRNSHDLRVIEKTRIRIECPEGSNGTTDCRNVREESGKFIYNFNANMLRDGCRITCQVRNESSSVICSINWVLNVLVPSNDTTNPGSGKNTSPSPVPFTITALSAEHKTENAPKITQTKVADSEEADKPPTFPVTTLVIILIITILGVTGVACLYVFASRSKFKSRCNKAVTPTTKKTDTHIPIGPTYATVNKNPEESLQEQVDSEKQRVSGTDDFYSEVNLTDNVDQTIPRGRSTEVQCSNTDDSYSEVNRSNDQVGLLKTGVTDGNHVYDEVYDKVENEAKQTRHKGSTSPPNASCHQDVSSAQADQLREQSDSSNKEVGDAYADQPLYAVVDK